MLLSIESRRVLKLKNQFSDPHEKEIRIGIFACDHCRCQFEIDKNLEQKLLRKHHFCSRRCQGQARKRNGCLSYVYSSFQTAFLDPAIREKCRQTMIEKYGAETTLQSKLLRDKFNRTMIEKYGVPTSLQSSEIKRKFNFAVIAQKRHETMKKNNSYMSSKEEDSFFQYLQRFGNVHRQIIVNKTWSIDFYIADIDLYIQYDGSYWHGLNRPIEEIKKFLTKRDRQIFRKWTIDRQQERWFKENEMELIRVPSHEFDRKSMTSFFFEEFHRRLIARRQL